MFGEDALNGKPIRIKLKTRHTLTGTIQTSTALNRTDLVAFLTTENSQRLKQRLGISNEKIFAEVDIDRVREFLELIPIDQIEAYELVETEVTGIHLVTQDGKPVTIAGFELQLTNIGTPGVIKVLVRIPDSSAAFEIPFVHIKGGIVEVPISVAFISYAKEDEEFVAEVSQRLRDNGVVTWFDKRSLKPGDDWEMQIEQGIENADFVIVFLSKATLEKVGFKNRELQLALKQQSLRPRGKIFLIPILLDDGVPPHDLRNLNWLRVADSDWFERLLDAVTPWYARQTTQRKYANDV